MKNKSNNQGISTLIMLIFLAVVATFISAAVASRLLLSIQRTRSLSDALVTTYSAESQLNSLIYNLLHNTITWTAGAYNPPAITLPDGTIVTIKGTKDPVTGEEILNITTTRPYAVNQLQLSRTVTNVLQDVEIVLALDCTGTMNYTAKAADPAFATISRMQKLKQSTLDLIDAIVARPDASQFHLGIEVFGIDAKWLKNDQGTNVSPNSGLNLTGLHSIRDAVDVGFGDCKESLEATNHCVVPAPRKDSPACDTIKESTNLGTPLLFAHDYYKAVPPADPNNKRVEIMITDGDPNTRTPYHDCPPLVADGVVTIPKVAPAQILTGDNAVCSQYAGFCDNFCSYPGPGHCLGFYLPGHCYAYTGPSAPVAPFIDPQAIDPGCRDDSIDFTACAAATTGQKWNTPHNYAGIRNPDVDLYVLTVFSPVDSDVEDLFKSIINSGKGFATEYYGLGNAADLPNALSNTVLHQITQSLTIKRVTP